MQKEEELASTADECRQECSVIIGLEVVGVWGYGHVLKGWVCRYEHRLYSEIGNTGCRK
jgi:hypothetical protein